MAGLDPAIHFPSTKRRWTPGVKPRHDGGEDGSVRASRKKVFGEKKNGF
jgi:hypothetical protein